MPTKLKLNLFFLYFGEGLAKALAMVAFGYLGYTLSDSYYGLLAFPMGVYFLLGQMLDAGLAPYGAREAARNPRRTARLAGSIALIRLGLVVAAYAVLALVVGVLQRPAVEERLVLLYGLALLPFPLVVNWAFEARDRMHLVGASTLLRQAVFLAGILWVVREPADVIWVPVMEGAGLFMMVAVQQFLFHRGGERIDLQRGRRRAGRVLREAFPMGASTVFMSLRWFVPLLALRAVASDAQMGHFEAAHQITIALHTFVWLYFVNLLPSMARATAEVGRATWTRLMRKSLQAVAWGSWPVLLVGSALSALLLPLIFGPDFSPAAPIFRASVWVILFSFLSGHHRYTLISFGHQRHEMRASGWGVVFSVAATGLLWSTDRLTPVTAAQAMVAAEIGVLLVARRYAARLVEPLPEQPLGTCFAVGLVATLAWGLLVAASPWQAAGAALVVFAAGFALVRPQFLRRGTRGGPPLEDPLSP